MPAGARRCEHAGDEWLRVSGPRVALRSRRTRDCDDRGIHAGVRAGRDTTGRDGFSAEADRSGTAEEDAGRSSHDLRPAEARAGAGRAVAEGPGIPWDCGKEPGELEVFDF